MEFKGFKKMLAMAGLSLTAATGTIKAAPGQDQLSPTSTPARVEHSVKKSKEQMPGFIAYPDFFPINKKGEFDRGKSLEMMLKIPLQELKEAFQKFNPEYPKTIEHLVDVMSMGNPETKALLKQLQKDEYMTFDNFKRVMYFGPQKIVTQEESNKLMKKKEKAMLFGKVSSVFILGGLAAMLIAAGLADHQTDKNKSNKPYIKALTTAGVITVSAMISSLSGCIYGHYLGEDAKLTAPEVRMALVDIHKQFFDAYRENRLRQKVGKLAEPVKVGKKEGDDELVTLTVGELRSLLEMSRYEQGTAYWGKTIEKLKARSK